MGRKPMTDKEQIAAGLRQEFEDGLNQMIEDELNRRRFNGLVNEFHAATNRLVACDRQGAIDALEWQLRRAYSNVQPLNHPNGSE
jgi:hypothetical protein